MQSGVLARDTQNTYKISENKNIKRVLISKNYNYVVEFNNNKKNKYTYEVELLSLSDLSGIHSITKSSEFRNYVEVEYNNMNNRRYDNDIHIRDLYPLEKHTKNKNKEIVQLFSILNDFILEFDSITRRVTKKEIVYKKNKSKSVLSIKISNYNYINIFMLPQISDYDFLGKFIDVPEKSKKPLNKLMVLKDGSDIDYLKEIIKNYFDNLTK